MSSYSAWKERLIEDAIQRFERRARERSQEGAPRVITISRELGSGGRRIAETLSQWLGWPLWDKEILDALASESRGIYESRMFEALDEKTQGVMEALILSLFGPVDKYVYFYLLPRAILTIAQNDAIILGRGAHLILHNSLRVRVVASLDTRIRNLMRFDGLSETVARERIRESDRDREAFRGEVKRRLATRHPELAEKVEHDLVINTDGFDIQEAASIVLAAATKKFDLQPSDITRGPGEG